MRRLDYVSDTQVVKARNHEIPCYLCKRKSDMVLSCAVACLKHWITQKGNEHTYMAEAEGFKRYSYNFEDTWKPGGRNWPTNRTLKGGTMSVLNAVC